MAVPPQERHSTRNVSKPVLGKHPRLRIPPDAGGLRIPHYGVMREEDIIFMSCPSFPHPSCPSSSDFPSFPVINITSVPSHENTSIVTKPDPSSMSPLKSSTVAPQDCPSSSELSSSMSPLKFPSQTECSSTTCSSRSQDSCSPLLLENQSSINDYADFTLFPTYSSKSQTEYSPSLPLNGTSTFHTLSHSLSPMNCCSTTDRLSFSSTSPLKCSCQPESSTTSCQNPIAISQIMYSSLSTQSCKSISKQTQSECSSMPQINGASTSRTNGQSVSPLDLSSCYFTPPIEDPSDFSPISISDRSKLSVHVSSSTSVLSFQPGSQDVKSLSDDCSPVDIPCVCTCEFSTDFLPEISSSHLTYHPCSPVKNDNHVSSSVDYASLNNFGASSLSPHEIPYILQSKDYSDLSNNITPTNGIIPPQMNTTTDPRVTFTSTKCNSTNIDPLTPWSTQSFQSSISPEIDVVSTNDQLSNDHLPVDGQYVHPCSCSLPNSVDSLTNSKVLNSPSFSTNTPPTPNFICPNSTNQTVFTSTHERHPKMISSCPHIFSSEATPKYLPFSEEENRVQECEICKASLENKVRMDQDRQLCENFLDSLSRFEDWLQIAQITTSQGNSYKTLHQEVKLALRKYEVLLTDMREKLLDLESLNRQYWRLAQTAQPMLLPSVLRSRMQEVNTLWDSLQGEAETLHRTLKSKVQQREEFETDQDDMKLCLTEMDLELSNVEYIYGGNSTEKIQQLKAFQEDVWSNMKRVEGLLERGDQLMDNSDPRDAADLEVEMTELGSYCQEIYIRLSRLQKRLVSTKLVFEDDFLDGAIEHLSSGSSDVFLDLDLEDGEVSSPVNDPSTSEALPVDLEWDPLGDVGRSSSHDGQESFYTATSAPWKLPQTSEGSRSSLSSYSGFTYSNMRKQQVKDPLDDIDANHIPPLDNCHLEWIEEQTHGQGWMETTSALHSSLLHLETGMPQDINSCSGEYPTGMKFSLPTDQADSERRMGNHFALPGYSWKSESPLISHVEMTDGRSQPNCSGQRRRPRKKKRAAKNLDTKGTLKPTKPDVSILMENGDDLSHLDLHESSYKPSCSLCVWIRRLVFASILFLVLVTSFLFPWGHQTCLSKSFSWSLMLTYVNGPPPT